MVGVGGARGYPLPPPRPPTLPRLPSASSSPPPFPLLSPLGLPLPPLASLLGTALPNHLDGPSGVSALPTSGPPPTHQRRGLNKQQVSPPTATTPASAPPQAPTTTAPGPPRGPPVLVLTRPAPRCLRTRPPSAPYPLPALHRHLNPEPPPDHTGSVERGVSSHPTPGRSALCTPRPPSPVAPPPPRARPRLIPTPPSPGTSHPANPPSRLPCYPSAPPPRPFCLPSPVAPNTPLFQSVDPRSSYRPHAKADTHPPRTPRPHHDAPTTATPPDPPHPP